MPAFTDSLLQLILLTLCVSISRADDLTDDGLDSKLEVMKEHLSPSLRGDGTSAPATVPEGGSERAIVILSWLIVSVGMIVVTFFFWTLKTQIKEFIVKCWTTTRADTSSGDEATTLNDIIFDPEEEQRASLSQSLLQSSSED